MARAVESVVFVLDVGPRMHPHLAQAARATADFITEKIVHKAKHQVCLLLFGASETRNRENDKSALEEGGEAEYSHIVEAHGLGPPDGDYIRTLHTLTPGHGHSDFKEALAVAAAVLVEQEGFRGTRRIVLLSNLCSRAQEDPEDALTSVLAEGLQQREIALEVLHLDVEEDDRQYDADKTYNLNQLAAICQELSHHERHFASGVALLSAFKFKEVSASATFSGHLAVGTKLHIPVKLCGKTAKEKLLTPGKESPDAQNASEGAETGIQRDTEYYYADQEAHGYDVVPETEVAKALRYGCNLVPFGDEQKQVFVFPTVRGLQLVGFVSAGHIPRHYYMKDVKLLVADKASPGGCAAMAALVAALLRQSQQAVIRFVSRNDSQPKLLLASPVAGSVAAVPHLLLNELPFMEDMRSYRFSSFTKKAWAPTQAQLDVAADLVQCMDLGAGGVEQLQPESTADPALHRLYWECGRRVVDPGVPLEEEDELAQEVLQPHPERLPGAAAALAAAAAAFPMHQAAKERRRAAVRIGLDDPAQDYARLKVEDGLTTEALEALQAAISELTLKSSGPHKLHTVVELVDVLREDCIVHDQPQLFNTFLTELEARCQADDSQREVWRRLCRREIKLICKQEAAGSELEEQQTQEWYSQHLMQ